MHQNQFLNFGLFLLIIVLFTSTTVNAQTNSERNLEIEASQQYQKGNYSKAIDLYQKALEINPNKPEIYNNLGTALCRIKKYVEAVSALNQALILNPKFAKAYLNLGLVYAEMGDHHNAIKAFSKAIGLNPRSIPAHLGLCENYLLTNQSSRAVSCYQELILLGPADETSLANYGLALKQNKQFKAAVEVLKSVLEKFPPHFETYNILANALFELHHYQEAIEAFNRALEFEPDNLLVRYNLAIAQVSNKNKASALEQYEFLKRSNESLAQELYQQIFSDKVIFVKQK